MTNIPVEERKNWVGSSESAVLLGCSPYATKFEIWHQKAGNIPVESLDGQERIEAGKFLEPAIGAWASDKWGWPIRNFGDYLRHESVPRMGASLDFEAESDGAPVEIKNVDGLIFRDQWACEGDEITDAPLHILVQVQHQLACRPGIDHGWIIACVAGNQLKRMRVPRHGRIIERIEREVASFWGSVEAGQEPRPDFQADAASIAALYVIAGDLIKDMKGDERLARLCQEYHDAKEVEKEAKGVASARRAEILTIIGDTKKVFADGFTISAGTVSETEVSYVRRAYRNVRINAETKEQAA